MRVCAITPTLCILSGEDGSPEAAGLRSGREDLDGAAATQEREKERHREDRPPHLLADHGGLKPRLCAAMLQLIARNPWVPSLAALLPLRLCRSEILETLRGFDPDLVDVTRLRWGRHLERLLGRHCPEWGFRSEPGTAAPERPVSRDKAPLPKVSIVLPTYNGTKYLRQSIDSCLRQTFANIEVLIVDDGSAADVAGIVRSYGDPRIRYHRHVENRGLPESLNTGFRNSTGDYLTWTSDDNYYCDTAIEEMVRFLRAYPDVAFVYAQCWLLEEGSEAAPGRILPQKPPSSLSSDNYVGACFLYTRAVYEAIGDYDPRVSLAEDYDYWIRVSKRFRMQRLRKPLYFYRFHQESLTGKHRPEEVAEKVRLAKRLNRIRA